MFSFLLGEVLQKIILLMLWECDIIIHAYFFPKVVNNQLISPFISNYLSSSLHSISSLTTSKVSSSSESA